MKCAGIVAEYNPFHKGHQLHMALTRRRIGEDAAIVCVMSGNFIQRGEPAALEKHIRAEAALRGGADLVLELPAPYALSSAECFAGSAMTILHSLGCVDYVSFGSESGDVAALKEAADLLLQPDFGQALREEMRLGISFAEARQRAMEKMSGQDMSLMARPNNILAVEYLKALRRLDSSIEPLAVTRRGPEHDAADAVAGLRSASAIRRDMAAGLDVSGDLPEAAAALYAREIAAGRGPVTVGRLEQSILTRLRCMSEEDFAALPDMSEGLHLRLMRAARSCGSLEELYAAVKTRRYALSRIRRAVICAWLGITDEQQKTPPPYARVLGMKERGREILKTAKKNTTVLAKPAAARRLEGEGRALFELEARATDLYVLGFDDPAARRGGLEWETSPVILL